MNVSDIFYVVASVCLVLITGGICYGVNEVVLTMRTLRKVLEDVKDTTGDISAVKNGIKIGALSLISKLLGESQERR